MRYLLANLYDFDPSSDRVPIERMEEVDRFILARYAELAKRIVRGYDAYDYSTIFQSFNAFMTVDLSSLYNDICKDRLYTLAVRSHERRSAQTAIHLMADGLTRLIAPILPVTADELWKHLPGHRDESVHLALFPGEAELASLGNREILDRWNTLIGLREEVLAQIEPLRKSKQIGSSLEAKVILTPTRAEFALLERYARDLPMLFIVSDVVVRPVATGLEAHEEAPPHVTIDRAGGIKCDRCWRYVPSVSSEPATSGLCERCQEALAETVNG
jgi:isoleucyl-tRNA synthetase